jgi:nicotinamidase-related amidase
MAITTIDPNTALIVIDLQKGIVSMPGVTGVEPVVANAVALTKAFRAHRLPVVLVSVVARPPGRTDQGAASGEFPPDFTQLLPALDRQDSDVLVQKRSPGAFTNTGLHETLQAHGVTQVVIVGVSTSMGVESTARQAFELGYNVTLPVDAMTDRSAEAHANSLTHSFPRMAETGSTRDVLDLLAQRQDKAA